MKALVTGSQGFIGRHLVARLLTDGWDVVPYDRPPGIEDTAALKEAMTGADVVFHLAALADVRNALKQPVQQVHSNLLLTQYVLETMRACEVKRLFFMSSAVVYGDCTDSPITERATSFPQQTSIYGAMKLASESLIAAYCRGYGMVADVFRTVSLVGAGYRHGNLMDFYRKLQTDPTRIEILGTGQQQKYYIDVHDVVDGVLAVTNREHSGCELWNISHDQPNTINDSIAAVCEALDIAPAVSHGPDPWAGDLPALVLDCSKLRAIGWAPKISIKDGMRATVRDFIERQL